MIYFHARCPVANERAAGERGDITRGQQRTTPVRGTMRL